jgi:hypothetical protein
MDNTSSELYAPNPSRGTQVLAIGREQSPLLCIDDFLANADALMARTRDATFIELGSLYPGVRAAAPAGYAQALLAAVTPTMQRAFGSGPADDLELCAFSLVTTEPSKLKLSQRIPHFDGPEVRRFAFIHYLCDARFGGTSFYRHRATGFECIDPPRLAEYRGCITRQLDAHAPAAEYASGDTELFERIHSVPAQFNRLVIYKGNALHSGDIPHGLRLTEDARRGRLTVNGFGHLTE